MSSTYIRRASVWIAPSLSAAVVIVLASVSHQARSSRIVAPSAPEGWYIPTEEDFRAEYERDPANQKVQSWKDYWGWITTFYNGTIVAKGWTHEARATIELVKPGTKQQELLKLTNRLGKTISTEWAKQSGFGKISTADLVRWSAVLIAARRAENGSGDQLSAALVDLSAQVTRKIELQPSLPRGGVEGSAAGLDPAPSDPTQRPAP
jgi:hypothetical protein